MFSIWEPAQQVERWRSSWTVAQVLLPLPQNWSSRFRRHQLPVVGARVPVVGVGERRQHVHDLRSHQRDSSTCGSQSDGNSRSHTVVFSPNESFAQTSKSVGHLLIEKKHGVDILKARIPSKQSFARLGHPKARSRTVAQRARGMAAPEVGVMVCNQRKRNAQTTKLGYLNKTAPIQPKFSTSHPRAARSWFILWKKFQ